MKKFVIFVGACLITIVVVYWLSFTLKPVDNTPIGDQFNWMEGIKNE